MSIHSEARLARNSTRPVTPVRQNCLTTMRTEFQHTYTCRRMHIYGTITCTQLTNIGLHAGAVHLSTFFQCTAPACKPFGIFVSCVHVMYAYYQCTAPACKPIFVSCVHVMYAYVYMCTCVGTLFALLLHNAITSSSKNRCACMQERACFTYACKYRTNGINMGCVAFPCFAPLGITLSNRRSDMQKWQTWNGRPAWNVSVYCFNP